ncbi:MAG: hypothetical protein HN368_10690, partial [Spirochaetales bacterium]|nr:hypothetical protein [Spirochaetales bacterium]
MKKKWIRFIIIFVGTIAAFACSLGTDIDTPAGTITFAFPKGVLSKGLGEDTYRVDIYYGL